MEENEVKECLVLTHNTGDYTRNEYPRAKGSLSEVMDKAVKARLEALKAQLARNTRKSTSMRKYAPSRASAKPGAEPGGTPSGFRLHGSPEVQAAVEAYFKRRKAL